MRGSARIYDVRMAQFVLKIEKLSHIMGPRASQDLRSPSLIMAPGKMQKKAATVKNETNLNFQFCNEELTSFQRFRGFFIKIRPDFRIIGEK